MNYATFIVALLCSACGVVSACPDGSFKTVEQEVAGARWVVVGTRASEEYSAAGPGRGWVDGTYYSVKVERVLSGPAVQSCRVFSENSSGRFPLDPRVKYLLFVSRCNGVFYVESKGNSAVAARAAEVEKKVQDLFRHKRANAA